MSTVISAQMPRSFAPDMFADLGVVLTDWTKLVNGVRTLTFDGNLNAAKVAAIRARMTSRDDVDQAARAGLQALRDAVVASPSLANVAALSVANANYQLGE